MRTDGNSALRFSKIHILNADGTADRILFDDDSEDMDPDWSPNGKKIAYSRNGIIYAANVDGTGAQELAFDPSARLYAPRWSPDGSRIAYSAETRADARATTSRPGDTFIYIVTAQGYGRRELTAGDQAAWSPDGEQLAVRVRSGTSSNLYVVHADGSGLSRVTTGPQLDSDPDWSPDSSRIAFASTRDGNAEIYLVNSDGTKPTRLTRHTSADTQPAWQP